MSIPALVRQNNYDLALEQGFNNVAARDPQHLECLGARRLDDGCYALVVLGRRVKINLSSRSMILDEARLPAEAVNLTWQILILHYLSAPWPLPETQAWVSFGDFAAARAYEPVYRARVISRLCSTAGRTRESFVGNCARLGGERVPWGDDGFRFAVFPQLPIIIARYEGDGELPVDMSFVYPDNMLALLPVEDLTVVSERLVACLQGGKIAPRAGR